MMDICNVKTALSNCQEKAKQANWLAKGWIGHSQKIKSEWLNKIWKETTQTSHHENERIYIECYGIL